MVQSSSMCLLAASTAIELGAVDSGCGMSCVQDATLEEFQYRHPGQTIDERPACGTVTFGDGKTGEVFKRVTLLGGDAGRISFAVYKVVDADPYASPKIPFLIGKDHMRIAGAKMAFSGQASASLELYGRPVSTVEKGGLTFVKLVNDATAEQATTEQNNNT